MLLTKGLNLEGAIVAHKRESIRKAVVNAVTSLTLTGSNVFSGITYNLADGDLPALRLTFASDPETLVEEQDEMGAIEIRRLPVIIVGTAKTTTTILDTLDDICEDVEIAVTGSASVASLVTLMRLESTHIELESDAELPVGTATMEWAAYYQVDSTAPSA